MKKFNKESYLKRLVIKKKLRNTIKYVYVVGISVLCLVLGLYLTYSKYFVKQEAEVIRTTVGNFSSGDVVIGAYLDGEYSSSIPGKYDNYIVEKIVCDNDAYASWNYNDWTMTVGNLSKKSKCNIYFKKSVSKVPDIIATVDKSGKCPTVNSDGSVTVTGAETTNGYLCRAQDAYGDSYYFRGNVTNNYVKFVGFYWRIVRINGDGSVRVIYDGTSAHANGETSSDRQIGTSAFNNSYNDNAYVGYMYGKTGASTYTAAHANTNDSTIKTYIDNWYKTNILGTISEQYLVDNIFCNDRSISSSKPSYYNNLGYGTNSTVYRWYYGPWENNYNVSMYLTCPNHADAFSVSDIKNGNSALTYPIGLISADEDILAGDWSSTNREYFLYTGQ